MENSNNSNDFDNMIESLKEKRLKLNQSSSFDEIAILWQQIKEIYSQSSKIVEDISKELSQLDSQQIQNSEEIVDLKFSDALKQMEELSNQIKTVSITQIPSLIKKISVLKTFCLNKLEEEKVKMEEII